MIACCTPDGAPGVDRFGWVSVTDFGGLLLRETAAVADVVSPVCFGGLGLRVEVSLGGLGLRVDSLGGLGLREYDTVFCC